MNQYKKLHYIISTVLVIIIGIAILSSLRPPGWILAGGIGWTDDPITKITRSELEEFPALAEAIHLADTSIGVHPTEHVRCSNSEGWRIINHFSAKSSPDNYSHWFHLEIDGQLYQVSIIFTQNPPPIA
jgi:hypothetical protein